MAFLNIVRHTKMSKLQEPSIISFKLFELNGKKKLLNFTVQPGNLFLNSINVYKNLKASKKF